MNHIISTGPAPLVGGIAAGRSAVQQVYKQLSLATRLDMLAGALEARWRDRRERDVIDDLYGVFQPLSPALIAIMAPRLADPRFLPLLREHAERNSGARELAPTSRLQRVMKDTILISLPD